MKKAFAFLIILLLARNVSMTQKKPAPQAAPETKELFDKMVATIDIPEVVKMLRNVKCKGMISLEHERNMRNPFWESRSLLDLFAV
ncbi:hypothetical protein [Labilibaculum euxinus]|uniref:Uncharacterized protein n=1 Tax=Labilibaculum euxinus TaxID=2686357 RepID=A0A7M4D4J3_9BACT|nr:hypothetical protein [Labilibaculum euxinus]MUP37572.1 hypothetical protein [Labilibaculum euxinus]MVB06777.1 hypothetical protein [Labilibaculum euxinus]